MWFLSLFRGVQESYPLHHSLPQIDIALPIFNKMTFSGIGDYPGFEYPLTVSYLEIAGVIVVLLVWNYVEHIVDPQRSWFGGPRFLQKMCVSLSPLFSPFVLLFDIQHGGGGFGPCTTQERRAHAVPLALRLFFCARRMFRWGDRVIHPFSSPIISPSGSTCRLSAFSSPV
mgnify:CR=1 FL=1